MLWFIAPRYFFDGSGDALAAVECPGVVDVDGVTILPFQSGVGFRVPAYSSTDGECLVGVLAPLSPLPSGWIPLTVEEAVEQFTAWAGRAPGPSEVF